MDPVFEIEALKQRALAYLRERKGYVPAGTVADALGVPTYAIGAALDAAGSAGEAHCDPRYGWCAIEQDQAPSKPEGEQLWDN